MSFLKWMWVNPWNSPFIQAVYFTLVSFAGLLAFDNDLPCWTWITMTVASYGTFNGYLMLIQGEEQ